MKKILTILSFAAITAVVHAQGYIAFFGGAANIQTNTAIGTFSGGPGGNGGTGGKIAAYTSGLTYDFALLYETAALVGSSSAPTNASWSLVQAFGNTALALGTNGPGPGNLYGPGANGGVGTALTALTTYSVELVGWSSTLGSFSQVLADITAGSSTTAGYLGWTTVGSITPIATIGGGDPTMYPGTWSNGTLILNSIAITATPEPASMALFAISGASLLLFRRKK
jgi:hypothetical protein